MPNLQLALSVVRDKTKLQPRFGIVLGSGLGGVVDHLDGSVTIDFKELPGFGSSTAAGHRGQLVLGELAGIPVVAMAGRLHRYGGWSTEQVTFPISLMKALGADRLIVSNAAGGLNPKFRIGDLVVIQDHIDWMYGSPQMRFSEGQQPGPGPREPTDTVGRAGNVYDQAMLQTALQAARLGGFTAYSGTYLATLGPTYETRAEYRMMRTLGADVVGMSTVPEVLAASKIEMRILALSVVSNVACPDAPNIANHKEVLAAGALAEPRMLQIVRAVLQADD